MIQYKNFSYKWGGLNLMVRKTVHSWNLMKTLSLEHVVQLSIGIIFLFNFFQLSSANADLVKPAFFWSVKYSLWQLPHTTGRVPRGPSPCRLALQAWVSENPVFHLSEHSLPCQDYTYDSPTEIFVAVLDIVNIKY